MARKHKSKSNEYYNDYENDFSFDIDDDEEDDAPIVRASMKSNADHTSRQSGFSSRQSSSKQASFSQSGFNALRQSSQPRTESQQGTPQRDSFAGTKYFGNQSATKAEQGQRTTYTSRQQSYDAPIHRMDASSNRPSLDRICIADLTHSDDAMAVANMVKEKRYVLIVNLNPLKNQEDRTQYLSVINFIDGVCFVTDTEFKEVVKGSGIFIIYHKDIMMNLGLDGYASKFNL